MRKSILHILTVTGIAGAIAFTADNIRSIDLDSMDKKVAPTEDFYRFANGTWLKNNPVPASESRWSNFNLIAERNNLILRKILEDAAANTNAKTGSDVQKVGTLYRLFMDTLKRESQGIKPVLPYISRLNKIENKNQLIETVAEFQKIGIHSFFNFYIGQDLKNSTAYITYISQGGLGLPDKDYYLKQDAQSTRIRDEYAKHIQAVSALFGFADKIKPTQIIEFETELARVCMSRTERRNQEKQYNKRAFGFLSAEYPNLRMDDFFKVCGINRTDSLIISQPAFFSRLNELFASTSVDDLRNYMLWCLMNQSSGFLDSKLEAQNFAFYGTVLTGAKEQKPMWKRGIAAANNVVGELLGKLFVAKVFTPDAKKRVNSMVDDIVEAFRVRINQLDWMSGNTKVKALEKLASFNRKFGYPDIWTDYSTLEILEDSYIENNFRSNAFEFKEMVGFLGKPIDRNRWGMLPQTVNAYYSPTLNEIVFPAAIMQPPFFDELADDAVNYGSIGAVIGHELTHGFDDQGSKYDKNGNLISWWTEEDRNKFEAKTKVLVNQFNGYFVSDSLHINGELTLGENIADLGGLTIAYEAFKSRQKKNPGKVMHGFTPEQRFFIGFAQIWKNNIRPEAMRQLILTDPHSPGEYRVFGTLTNMGVFFEVFGIKEGNRMFRKPEERAIIW